LSEENGVVVRGATAEGRRWIYAVNATPQQRTLDLGFAGGPKSAGLLPWGLAVFKLLGVGADKSILVVPGTQ
jgi:hypothetical protein